MMVKCFLAELDLQAKQRSLLSESLSPAYSHVEVATSLRIKCQKMHLRDLQNLNNFAIRTTVSNSIARRCLFS